MTVEDTVDASRGQVPAAALSCELICDLGAAEQLRSEWDALAVAARVPMMSPACVLAWWQNLAPHGAAPRIVTMRREGQLAAIAPFYTGGDRRRCRHGLCLPGIELAGRLAPLCRAGDEPAVARALADALCHLTPELVTLQGTPCAWDWAGSLRDAWPARAPALRRYQVINSPTLSLSAGSFERWLEGKSANFRSSMRRLRRKFHAAGGVARWSTPESLRADVEAFARLHTSRWEGRGTSRFVLLGQSLTSVLYDIGQALLALEGRFRLRVLEVDGQPITSQLFLAAGPRVQYINGGWDQRYAALKPPMLGILDVIEDAFARGEELIDLGTGEQSYKQRFADAVESLSWSILIPSGPRLPLTLLKTAPTRGQARLVNAARSRLSERQLSRYLRMREQARGLARSRREPARSRHP